MTMPAPGEAALNLAYFVHDLADPAVERRLRMLAPYLADAIVIGFHRGVAPDRVAGWPVLPLGRTADARLGQRLVAVLRARARIGGLARAMAGRTAILSRQLETLVLARAARARFAPGVALVQECLDVHRLLTDAGPKGAGLRWVEGRLLRGCQGLVASSPAFLRQHLEPAHGPALPPVLLLENKVLAEEAEDAAEASPPPGPPWRIGWYGMIRCRRSLALLADLVRALPGQVEVEIRGRPALAAVPEFEEVVRTTPGLSFLGPYDRRRDLGRLYRGVHFAWAIDLYEAGANSDWLLPNRIYEGTLHGAVPIALRDVETGRWLAARGVGMLLGPAIAEDLAARFAGMDAATIAAARSAVARIPRGDVVEDGEGARRLAALLGRGRAAS